MTLRDTMARDARNTLMRLDHFAEEVVYVFKDGTPERTVRAVVNRLNEEAAEPGMRQASRRRALVEIAVDSTTGITTWAQGDKIRLPMEVGETAVEVRVLRRVSQDEGTILLEVRE